MTSQLVGSSFANGVQLPNYVNGRLLAAEDLATGQATLLTRDTWAGQAAGPGIVSGLWATAAAATVTVTAGLGITPSGEPVSLPAPVSLPLSLTTTSTSAAASAGSFTCCSAAATGSQPVLSGGAYLLTALPACQLQGQAPMTITPGSDTPAACTAQWQVNGVQFKAIPLPLGDTVNGIGVTNGNLRNLLAHWCFGTPQLATLGSDPFNFNPAYRGLDQLASTDLTPCDLPLCVFYWDAGTVTFLDNWSVRRRVTRPDVSAASWTAVVADQRTADGEARFLQFQDQITDLVTAGTSRATVAANVFGLLPPAGFLPVALDRTPIDIATLYPAPEAEAVTPDAATAAPAAADLATVGEAVIYRPIDILSPTTISLLHDTLSLLPVQSGFVPGTFFGTLARFGGFITWDLVEFALRQSYSFQPVPTAQEQAEPPGTATAAATSPAPVSAPVTVRFPAPALRTAAAAARTTTPAIPPAILRTPFPVLRPPVFVPVASAAPTTAPTQALITYYYVTENFIGALNTLSGTGSALTPYLFFVKNQYWPPRTLPPLVTA